MAASLQKSLIETPPPKCPYFTLPDVRNFVRETRASRKGTKGRYVSISSLWGPARKMTDETTTDFLLNLLKHSQWDIDFDAVAIIWGVSGSNQISRLRSIVEKLDYRIEGESKIVGGRDPQKTGNSPPKENHPKKTNGSKHDQAAEHVTQAKSKPVKTKKRKTVDTSELSEVVNKKPKRAAQVAAELPVTGSEAAVDNEAEASKSRRQTWKRQALSEAVHSDNA